MSVKLTLVMEPTVIKTAKKYARHQKTSVSKLVERYLTLVASDEKQPASSAAKLGPLTSSLAGAVNLRPEDREKSADDLIGEARMGRFG